MAKLCFCNRLCNSSRKSRIDLNFSTETHNNDLQNMLNDQLYKFDTLDFRIFMGAYGTFKVQTSKRAVTAC